MQRILCLLIFVVAIIETTSAERATNSSILLKRCSNNNCHKSKSLTQTNKSPSFFGIFKKKYKKVRIVLTNCTCVPVYNCDDGVIITGSGFEIIDLRSRRCGGQINVCCYSPYVTTVAPTTTTRQLPTVPTTTTTTTPQPVTNSLNCYCVPAVQCPYFGAGQIDVRQTVCPVSGMVCCQAVPILPSCYCKPAYQCTGTDVYQIDPRFQYNSFCGVGSTMCCNRAGVPSSVNYATIDSNAISKRSEVKNIGTSDECVCIKSWHCPIGHIVLLDAAIDSRFTYCADSDEVCCRLPRSATIVAGNSQVEIINPQVVHTPFIVNQSPSPNPANCGKLGQAPPKTDPSSDTTYFAEFPWMVALLLRQPGMNDLQLCGGSMISTKAVLTAAHCLYNRPSGVLVARFGEWDTRFTNESLPYQEANVKTILTHPQFNSMTLFYNVALLILDKAVNIAGNVQPICLPTQGTTFTSGTRCWASGWGRNAFGNAGQYQTILKKVDLPIVDNLSCQQLLRNTRLGPYFSLHGTFICAGGEQNKDTCQGDGGGPLVCPTSNGQYIQAGIVSWGIGCGSSSVPAVYASVAQLRTWIDQQLANHGAN